MSDAPPSMPGVAVDAQGGAVIDPTKNVLDLVLAAVERQDDLRKAEQHFQTSMHEVLVRSRDHDLEAIRRESALRNDFQSELRKAETARLDAIRAVDVAAVQQAAQVSATQAATLAQQVATSAETLRTQVAASAQAATVSLAAALEPIIRDIADLRRAQYEAQGKSAQTVETRTNTGQAAYLVFGAGSVLLTLALIAVGIYAAVKP